MAVWKTDIGNGSGSMFFLKQEIIDGSYLTVQYVATLNDIWTSGLNNVQSFMSGIFGIYANTAENKATILRRIKNEVFRLDSSTYYFNIAIYINQTLDEAQVMSYIKNNDVATLLSDPNTEQLTDITGAGYLEYLL